jgi:sulfite reductase (NADPH) hemoprotein beta-component
MGDRLMVLQVVTANRLGDGRVVYLADEYLWVEEIGRARVAETEGVGKALVAIAEKAVADRIVVAPYLIDVKVEGDHVTPTRYREVLRALGPSTHPEFGRPADVTAVQR